MMENLQSKRIYFDAEDRPPPSYWHGEIQMQQPTNDDNFKISYENGNFLSSKQIKTKIDPEGEFITSHLKLNLFICKLNLSFLFGDKELLKLLLIQQ